MRPNWELSGTRSKGYASCTWKFSEDILTHPGLYGKRVTKVLKFKARFTVVGFVPSKGRAKALMSQVPPESILQGAELVMGFSSRNFLRDLWGVDIRRAWSGS